MILAAGAGFCAGVAVTVAALWQIYRCLANPYPAKKKGRRFPPGPALHR
jgi:hypothetical protein